MWPENSTSSVGSQELQQIVSEVKAVLFYLVVLASLWRHPWFTQVIAKMFHQFLLAWLADR